MSSRIQAGSRTGSVGLLTGLQGSYVARSRSAPTGHMTCTAMSALATRTIDRESAAPREDKHGKAAVSMIASSERVKGTDVKTAKHPVYELTTYELNEHRSALERAIEEVPFDSPVPEGLRKDLADVIAEQDQRARIRQASRRSANQDHYCVRQLTTAELERTRRELQANLGLITPDSPAHVPIQAHMRAIDTELAERAGNHQASGVLP